MQYREFAPHPALRQHVRCYWQMEIPPVTGGRVQRVLPDGCIELILHYRAPVAILGGQLTAAIELATDAPLGMVGVRFQPWAAQPLLGFAMSDITDCSLPVADILPRRSRQWPGAFPDVTEPGAMLRRLERRLLARLAVASTINPLAREAIARIDASCGKLSVASLANDLLVSERHLNRTLNKHVGLSAKAYSRIRRLQYALDGMDRGLIGSLADAAAFAGYSDQAHFSRDVKRMCGVSPRVLLQEGPRLVAAAG